MIALNLSERSYAYSMLNFFPSQVMTIEKNNLKLSHLSCLNYAGKAMTYSKGQSAFIRHDQSLIESFRILLNPFLLEQSQDTLRQQVFSDEALFAFM